MPECQQRAAERVEMPRLLLAFDKFKGTLTSRQVADALGRGIVAACPAVQVTTVPVADGGDGTVAAALDSGYRPRRLVVAGPLGDDIGTEVAVHGDTAVAEVATVCGLAQLPYGEPQPLTATSRGVGELLLAVADLGVKTVVLGLGGSATSDGGAGMLEALGVRLRDRQGARLPAGGGALARLAGVEWSGLDDRVRELRLVVASDVDNPLLGPTGAAHTFGPQKGARADAVEQLETGLRRLVTVLDDMPTPLVSSPAGSIAREPGAGAAGGLGFGMRLLGAEISSGARFVLDLLGLGRLVRSADLVLTGEGRLDSQSLRGKAPIEVARVADELSVPTAAVVGQLALSDEQRRNARLAAVWAMSDYDPCTAQSSTVSTDVLTTIGREIGESLAHDPASTWVRAQHELHHAIHHLGPGAPLENSRELQCPS